MMNVFSVLGKLNSARPGTSNRDVNVVDFGPGSNNMDILNGPPMVDPDSGVLETAEIKSSNLFRLGQQDWGDGGLENKGNLDNSLALKGVVEAVVKLNSVVLNLGRHSAVIFKENKVPKIISSNGGADLIGSNARVPLSDSMNSMAKLISSQIDIEVEKGNLNRDGKSREGGC
ncbi:hypothetical protein Goklo_015647 [Gossypium klotzschianum]|uniref:Uncharacterized protein n=1 Tax=Gossypium klotzschianum TaxID=34286 RepID=A0A7J8UBP7_9ROSI|nr:hypothetical protein [Gossypium klotzschianum]